MSTTMMLITMTARRISDRRARRPTLLKVGIAVVCGVTGVIDVTSMFDRVRLLRGVEFLRLNEATYSEIMVNNWLIFYELTQRYKFLYKKCC